MIYGPTWKRVELVLSEGGLSALIKLCNDDDNVEPRVMMRVMMFQQHMELTELLQLCS